MRLDVKMVECGLAQSREKARAFIMAGVVTVDGTRVDKPGYEVQDHMEIAVKEDPIPFVSRGGLKLDQAIRVFELNVNGLVAADIGASTGGFTDCMLQQGARSVYAIDVGYGQLDWKLRNDPRVIVMERTNARNMQPDWFEQALEFASIDVSFISLRHILPPLLQCLKPGARVVALIKPQFEAGRAQVGKNGVVRSASIHTEVCTSIVEFAYACGYSVCGLYHSPVKGPKGNIEFLLLLQNEGEQESGSCPFQKEKIARIVHEAHTVLE